jgi:hypothetical protein
MIISRIFDSGWAKGPWIALHFGFSWAGKGWGVEKKRDLYTRWKLEANHFAGVLGIRNGRLSTEYLPSLLR